MSDDWRLICRSALVAALGVALVAPAVDAQRPTPYDRLRDYWAERSASAEARLRALRITEDSAVTDTTRSLRFEFVTSASLAPLATEAARVADSLVRRTWMPARPGPKPRFTIHGRAPAADGPEAETVSMRLALSAFDADGGRTELALLDSASPAVNAAQTTVHRSTVESLINSLDPTLSSWMLDRPSAYRPTPSDWRNVWWELATYPTLPARGCMAGELRSCQTALGLTVEKDPIRVWYDASLRQVLGARGVPGWRGGRLTEAQRAVVQSCAGGRDDAACLRFLSDTALGARVVEPGPRSARSLLLRFAFSFPTDSAAQARAAYAPGLTLSERLVLASGLPFDELLRRFQQHLSERRTPPVAPPSALLWVTCLWCLFFGALSLRSTRWRG